MRAQLSFLFEPFVKVKLTIWLLATVSLAAVAYIDAQPPKTLPRIGYLAGGNSISAAPSVEAFRQGLRDLGYIDGKNIIIDRRYAEGKPNRIASLIDELVQLRVDVIVAIFLPGILAAKDATQAIPIVMVAAVDPVTTGLVASLARPGGNITGLTTLQRDLSGKRLQLLTELIPGLRRVAILWNVDGPGSRIAFNEYETAARALKIQLQSLELQTSNPDLEPAFAVASKARAGALITIRNPLLRRYTNPIAQLATKNRLPSMHEGSESVKAGGLISYGTKDAENYKRAAYYVDRILKGAKPADLPIEQPTKFELVINLKTAKQIGLRIPPNVLARADRLIR